MRPTTEILEITSLSALDHVLRHRPKKVRRLTALIPFERLSVRAKEIYLLAKENKIPVDIAIGKSGDRISEPLVGSLASFEYQELKPFLEKEEAKTKSLVIVLDHLQDPQNFGAIARTAEGLGAAAILIPKDRSVSVTAGVYHASVGAIETIPVILVQNVGEALRKLKEAGFWSVGTALSENSKPLAETPSFEKIALVLGAELEGISSLVEKTCDWIVQIPLTGKVQSLNVSATAAILVHHFLNPKS